MRVYRILALTIALFPSSGHAWVSTPRRLARSLTSPNVQSKTFLFSSAALPESSDAAVPSVDSSPVAETTTLVAETAITPATETSTATPQIFDIPIQKITNALLLITCFGYAAYTIFNIDEGMTRGWTQSEIAMRIPLDNWANYEESLAEKPIYTKTMINVVIYLLGDWLSQTVFQKRNVLDFDASRTLKNGFIGLCFGPLVHEYYQFSDHILPVDGPNSLVNRLEKIFMDQTVYLSVKASIYVAAVALLAGESWHTARTNVQDKIGGIVLTAWKFWPLVHCITYSVIPAQHRILWVNCVDLIWNAILASMSSSSSTEEEETIVPAEEDALFVMRQDILPAAAAAASLEEETSLFSNSTVGTPENVTVY